MDIIAVGELLMDMTPIRTQDGIHFKPNPGGAPCNMLAMAQKMGAATGFIGKVGNDQFGHTLKQTLIESGINTEGLVLSDNEPTTLAFVHLSDDGERSFSFYRKGCGDVMLTSDEVDVSLIDRASVLHFGSLSFTDEPIKSTVLKLLAYAKSKKKLITYDPNYRPALWSSEKSAVEGMKLGLKYADVLKVSEEEAYLITGKHNLKEAGVALMAYGIALVTITLGSKGAMILFKNSMYVVKGYQADVKDTTGAGDAFFGTLVSQLIKYPLTDLTDDLLINMVTLSNGAASLAVEGYGGIPSLPTKDKVLIRCYD